MAAAPRSTVVIVLIGALVATACGFGASGSPTPGSPSVTPQGSPPSGSPSAAPATLLVWDQEVRNAITPVLDQLNDEFEAAHPGVTIERQSKSFEDLKATVKLALQDANGPDVTQINQGRPDMGAAVQAGSLLALDDYAARYGWDKRWGPAVNARNSFSDDGKQFGTGSLYGASLTGEIVGLFYNKEKLTALGLQPPATFAEFEQQLAMIKGKGEVPIAFGNTGGDAIQIYGSILETLVDRAWLDDFIFGRGGRSFDTPETRLAAEKLLEFSEKGYFTRGYEGISYDDAWKLFAGGKGVYFWTGSWIGGDLVQTAGEKFGFLRTPPQQAGGSVLTIGGVGLPFAIRKTSTKADLAAEYIDWVTGDRAMELLAKAGVLPSHGAPGAEGTGALQNEMAAAFAEANSKDEVGHYIDWAGPTLYDAITAGLAKVLAKRQTSGDFVKAIDADYQAFLKTLE
ncbi:MAG TPA: extracellular solute-binding protein [Candidatus Limnocylindrales bacterium]|nr:extracellular solute-binding protein [Candidatus Limnocylindrales bacterium]